MPADKKRIRYPAGGKTASRKEDVTSLIDRVFYLLPDRRIFFGKCTCGRLPRSEKSGAQTFFAESVEEHIRKPYFALPRIEDDVPLFIRFGKIRHIAYGTQDGSRKALSEKLRAIR